MTSVRQSAPVQIQRDLHRRLRVLAALRGSTMIDLADIAITDYLAEEESKLTRQELAVVEHLLKQQEQQEQEEERTA